MGLSKAKLQKIKAVSSKRQNDASERKRERRHEEIWLIQMVASMIY